ncbi:MAG: flagellar biosynthesis anti-sigma factor FlgM [Peptostreptococcaceae bacterium]
MKINSTNINSIMNNYNTQMENKYHKSTPATKKDKIEISESGKYLSKINTSKEEINLEKVNEIKNKIENGTYKIDSRKLAQKIINSLKEDK